jgi:hypothetical protein
MIDNRHEPPWADLDEGIRETVVLLWNAGFEPTDSGDGRRLGTKADMEEALDVPHVFMVCPGDDLIDEARRLWRLAVDAGVVKAHEDSPLVQATYSPDDGVAVLELYGRLP